MLLQKETPLANAAFWAARRGNLTLLRLLLNSGRVDVDCRDSVRTGPFSTRMLGAGCPPLAWERLLNTLPFTALVPFFMRLSPLSCVCLPHPFQKVQSTIATVQSLSHVQLFGTPWTAARRASLSFAISPGVCSDLCRVPWETYRGNHYLHQTGGVTVGEEAGQWEIRIGPVQELTRWMWVWVNSGRWWWTRRPGMLRFMGSQWVGHDSDWTELNWSFLIPSLKKIFLIFYLLPWKFKFLKKKQNHYGICQVSLHIKHNSYAQFPRKWT